MASAVNQSEWTPLTPRTVCGVEIHKAQSLRDGAMKYIAYGRDDTYRGPLKYVIQMVREERARRAARRYSGLK